MQKLKSDLSDYVQQFDKFTEMLDSKLTLKETVIERLKKTLKVLENQNASLKLQASGDN